VNVLSPLAFSDFTGNPFPPDMIGIVLYYSVLPMDSRPTLLTIQVKAFVAQWDLESEMVDRKPLK
jgi:hypothetical protein